MMIITSDINKQTYVPTLGVFSLFLLFYKREHPKTLEYVSVPQQVKFSHYTFSHLGILMTGVCFSFC